MNFKTLLFSAVTLFSLQANAQMSAWVADSVQMSSGYANDVFYSLKNGKVGSPVSNTNWHLGFEMIPGGPGFGGVSIIANHVQDTVNIYSLHATATAKFASLSFADTIGKTILYNADSSWDWGAFNVNTSGALFDYGWGKYNSTTHMVDGDSLYMLTIGTGTNTQYYKMTISHYESYPNANIYYAFHIASFDNTIDHQDTIRKSPSFMSKNFGYFNILNNTVIDREPDQKTWDVVFTRYIEYLNAGPGPLQPYGVTGVLSNVGVDVADVRNVDADTTTFNGRTFTRKMCEIGSDWKEYIRATNSWKLDSNATFFIKTIVDTGAIYQIKFTGFTSSLGKAVFAKRIVQFPANVHDVNNIVTAHTLVPNPATTNADLVINTKEAADARFIVTDITGKVMQNTPVKLNSGLNALRINTANYAAGTYIVTVTNGSWKINEKLTVQH